MNLIKLQNFFGALFISTLAFNCASAEGLDYRAGLVAASQGNIVKAIRIWTPLAEKGDLVAQSLLGKTYAEGFGKLKPDYSNALFWLQKCVSLITCQFELAKLYYEGKGVRKDLLIATNLFLGVAMSAHDFREGKNEARYYLGLIYYRGEGRKRDETESRKWLLLAANDGFHRAQWFLGSTFMLKSPLSREDLIEADKWFLLAMQSKDLGVKTIAEYDSKLIEKKMTSVEIGKAHQLAKSWIRLPAP
jgi:TPR repeat protein